MWYSDRLLTTGKVWEFTWRHLIRTSLLVVETYLVIYSISLIVNPNWIKSYVHWSVVENLKNDTKTINKLFRKYSVFKWRRKVYCARSFQGGNIKFVNSLSRKLYQHNSQYNTRRRSRLTTGLVLVISTEVKLSQQLRWKHK